MTDAEIKKALGYCASNALLNNACDECPYNNRIFKYARHCTSVLSEDALDLINRQQAEVERLKAEYKVLKADEEREHQYCKNVCEPKYKAEIERLQKLLDDKCDRCIAKEKAEAIKEFADKVKALFADDDEVIGEIDNLVKEMVGDAE